MKTNIRYIGLAVGLFSIIISFLFFARQQGTYQLLLIGGLLTSLVFYLSILFSRKSIKTKVIWTIVIVILAIVQWLTEPFLIKSSYLIYVKNNINELTEVNHLLLTKPGGFFILNDEIKDKNELLTQNEKNKLIQLRQKLNVHIINKSDNGIYYELWGFLDVRLGVTYWIKNEKPDISYQHLTDKWYH